MSDKLRQIGQGSSSSKEMARELLDAARSKKLDVLIEGKGVSALSDKISIQKKVVSSTDLSMKGKEKDVSIFSLSAKNSTTGTMEEFAYFEDTPEGKANCVDSYLELAILAKSKEMDTNTAINQLKSEEEDLLNAIGKDYIDQRQEIYTGVDTKDDIKTRKKEIKGAEKDLNKKNNIHEKFNHQHHKYLAENTESAFLEYTEGQTSILVAQLKSISTEINGYNKALRSGAIDSRTDEVAGFLPSIEPQLLFILGGMAVELGEHRHDTWFDDNKKVKPDADLYEVLESAGVPVKGTKGIGFKELLNPLTVFNIMTKGKVKNSLNNDLKEVFGKYRTGELKYSEAIAVITAMRVEDKSFKKVMKKKLYEKHTSAWKSLGGGSGGDALADAGGDDLYAGTDDLDIDLGTIELSKKSLGKEGSSRRKKRRKTVERKSSKKDPETVAKNRGTVLKESERVYATEDGIHVLESYRNRPIEELIDLYYEGATDSIDKDTVEYVMLETILSEGGLAPTKDKDGVKIYTSFENNMTRLGQGNTENGTEEFWSLFQKHYMTDSFVGDLNERYTNALDYNKAKSKVNSINQDTYIPDYVGLLDKDDEDGILVNAFVQTLSKRTSISSHQIANLFQHYDGDYAEAAGFIEEKSGKELGDASLLETVQHQGVPGMINRGMNQLVGGGFVSPAFAHGVNKLSTTLLGGAKLGSILATGYKAIRTGISGLKRGWKSLFGGEGEADTARTEMKGHAGGALKYFAINQGVKIAEDPDGYWERASSNDSILWGNVLGFLNPDIKEERRAEAMKKSGSFERGHSSADLFEETVGRKSIGMMLSRGMLEEGKKPDSIVINPEKFEEMFPVIFGLYSTELGRKKIAVIIDKIEEHFSNDERWTWTELQKYKGSRKSMKDVRIDASRLAADERAADREFDDAVASVPDGISKDLAAAKLSGLEPGSSEFERVVDTLVFTAAHREKLSVDALQSSVVNNGTFGHGEYQYDKAADKYTLTKTPEMLAEEMFKRLDTADTGGDSALDWLEDKLDYIEDNSDSMTDAELKTNTEQYFKVLSSVFRQRAIDPSTGAPSIPASNMLTYSTSAGVETEVWGGDSTSLQTYFGDIDSKVTVAPSTASTSYIYFDTATSKNTVAKSWEDISNE